MKRKKYMAGGMAGRGAEMSAAGRARRPEAPGAAGHAMASQKAAAGLARKPEGAGRVPFNKGGAVSPRKAMAMKGGKGGKSKSC